ncbi:uncharacterized protein LOC132202501 [Neocloeon triangulifer]|uniref:uncharacterized protein LOC132202501 n=1 Tax=Neocloeon triangulifer TaxID=2078957 RepID=UPI00286EECB6|nr:uncharacterized protein LOC132202501 [Neocloeon triangulifer]
MILIKLLPLWLTLSLITAATRPERRRRDLFSRAHWWETGFKTPRRGKQWPKRSSYDSPCVCVESQGLVDLGDGHWPQVVPVRQCGVGGQSMVTVVRTSCVSPEPVDGYSCTQRTYGIKVLRRREGPTSRAPQGRDTIPPELRDDWEFIERRVNSSCELTLD